MLDLKGNYDLIVHSDLNIFIIIILYIKIKRLGLLSAGGFFYKYFPASPPVWCYPIDVDENFKDFVITDV